MGMITRFFGVDADWERPEPTPDQRRADLWLALGWFLTIGLGTEFIRGSGQLGDDPRSIIEEYLAIGIVSALVAWRRRFPLTVGFLIVLHLFVSQYVVGIVAATLPIQVLYFFGLYSAVAWGRDRQWTMYVCAAVLLVLFGWFTYAYAISTDVASALAESEIDPDVTSLFSPYVSMSLYALLSNLIFFIGAIVLGQLAWNGARSTAMVVSQARTISHQSEQLREQAVIDERLRIARELHDVVAHHISAMGVQAAAAKRVLSRDLDAATEALSSVESSSREAVTQMRALLGALRAGEMANGTPAEPGSAGTAAEPGGNPRAGPREFNRDAAGRLRTGRGCPGGGRPGADAGPTLGVPDRAGVAGECAQALHRDPRRRGGPDPGSSGGRDRR